MGTDIVALLAKKRRGLELTDDEMREFVSCATNKSINEAQIGAMLMAISIRSLNKKETVSLTRAMIDSGYVFKWKDVIICDKHSTGGVGDKISIPLAPALAALGVKVPMLSGRGLGLTGGTLDKLESIPGFRVNLSKEELIRIVKTTGAVIASATDDICPGDKILYGIRDVTATVDCDELIVGSILAKKAAAGVQNLILDIKVGRAALFNSIEDAKRLAYKMKDNAALLGMKMTCVLTTMDTPIGNYVGNSLEIEECIEVLLGRGPEDINELVRFLGGTLLEMSGKSSTREEGETMIQDVIDNGKALKKYHEMLIQQGVAVKDAQELCYGDYRKVLPIANRETEIVTDSSGWVANIDGKVIAEVVRDIGGGRKLVMEPLDHSAGIVLRTKVGAHIEKGVPWCSVYHNCELGSFNEQKLAQAITITGQLRNSSASRILQVI